MQQYHDLLREILEKGVFKEDRTGVGTYSVFGHQIRFNLADGFPLVTTKKIHFKSIIHELLWFLRGDTNVKYLNERGVSIWDSWQDPYGSIGKGYGHQWRNWTKIELIEPKKSSFPCEGKLDCTPSVLGVAKGSEVDRDPHFYNIWSEMIHRCYNPEREHYKWYGGSGVKVCDRWLKYDNFISDLPKIEGWYNKCIDLDFFSLDKDYYGSNTYAPDTCIWLSKDEQRLNTSRTKVVKVIDTQGKSSIVVDLVDFCFRHRLDYSTATKVIRGEREHTQGFYFTEVPVDSNVLVRCRKFDQIRKVIQQIKNDPNSRRIIVSSWNTADIEEMLLPPCHTLFQFYVANGKLSCQMYQRSADVFLGVPFNIASYALLTHMIAQVCGYEVGDYVHTFGDLHLYKNHINQAITQLSREPFPLPKLELNKQVKSIDDFVYEDIQLVNYNYHPPIKAEVAV